MDIYLDVLKKEDMKYILEERNKTIGVLRTPFMLTLEQQMEFYNNICCNRNSKSRYFAVRKKHFQEIIGMVGLENIEFENGIGEISIIVGAGYTGVGVGDKAVEAILNYGFNSLRLQSIYGECYKCNTNIEFWIKQVKKYNEYSTILPNRKFLNGEYFDSLYFNFKAENFIKRKE